MAVERLACVACCVVIGSAAAVAQRSSEPPAPGLQTPSSSTVERSYPAGGIVPSRRVQTTQQLDGREILSETSSTPALEGTWQPVEQVTTETTHPTPNVVQTTRDTFAIDQQGRRILLERTQIETDTASDASSRTVQNTWVPGLNGPLSLASRRIEETRSVTPGVRQTGTTVWIATMNEALQPSERTEQVERQVSADLVRHESAEFVRDLNGRWRSTETRSLDVRRSGSSEDQDETIRRPDDRGNLVVSERRVTRASRANGQEQIISETYSHDAEGFVRSDHRLGLRERVRITTTAAADGSSRRVEELEARNRIAPGEPVRVVRRTVDVVRRIGPDRWTTERQIFELGVNGRLVLVASDTGEFSDK